MPIEMINFNIGGFYIGGFILNRQSANISVHTVLSAVKIFYSSRHCIGIWQATSL